MLHFRNRITALGASMAIVVLLVSGCNQPAPLKTEGAVDLSVTSTKPGNEVPVYAAAPQANTLDKAPEEVAQPIKDTAPLPAAEEPKEGMAKEQSIKNNPADNINNENTEPKKAAIEKQPVKATAVQSPPQHSPETVEPPAKAKDVPPAEAPKVALVKDRGSIAKIKFEDLYSNMTVRGVNISDDIKSLSGKKVEMVGFMAPPLTAKVNFFVLTKVALTICPFCSSDSDWPIDIVVVFMPKGKEITPTDHQVKVSGTLSVGSQQDEATGFVSLIRIMADKVEVLK